MEIIKKSISVVATFLPEEYWLRKNTFNPDFMGEWCLTRRIDMSYKGKLDQEGTVVMFLDNDEAQIFREAGFNQISGGDDPTNFE